MAKIAALIAPLAHGVARGHAPADRRGMTLTAAEVVTILLGAIRRRSEEEEPC
ncbi:hypothetical protein WME98_08310 [Sorangium sp. So ce296]|uniref:hypothetical protein n=1 Tax=Sorangium sp. So ce296 TaxID=3133296 RepID=UPI003F61BA2E